MGFSWSVGSFAMNTSTGNQSVDHAGLTTTPKIAIFFGNRLTAAGYAAEAQSTFGCATSATERWAIASMSDDAQATTDTAHFFSDLCIVIPATTGSTTRDGSADFVSFDADVGSGAGFTINVDDAPAVSPIINYVLIGGTDITAQKAGKFTLASTGSPQAFTGPGFEPDFLLVGGSLIATASTTGSVHSLGHLGFANSSTSEAGLAWSSQDGQAAATVSATVQKAQVLTGLGSAGTLDFEANLTSFDATGYTVAVTDLPAGNRGVGYLAVAGGLWEVFTDTQKTSTGTDVTALSTFSGHAPVGAFFASVNQTASASVNSTAMKVSLGASDGTNEGGIWFEDVDASATSVANQYLSVTKALVMATSTTTTDAAADCSFQADQLTLDWTTADATAREFIGFAAGSSGSSVMTKAGVITPGGLIPKKISQPLGNL